MVFTDDRINFCFNTYLSTDLGRSTIGKIFECMPKEIFDAINGYKNTECVNNSKKYKVYFEKSSFNNNLDNLIIKVKNDKITYSIKVFFANFNQDLTKEPEINKTILFYEEFVRKSHFSSPQKIKSHYATLSASVFGASLNIIEDRSGNIRRYSCTLKNTFNQIKNLKLARYYDLLDFKMAEKNIDK